MHAFVVAQLFAVPKRYRTQLNYWKALEEKTGVDAKTIEKIARREIEDPGVKNIETLADHFGYTPRKAAALARRQKQQAATA